jgi:hypothetical protein
MVVLARGGSIRVAFYTQAAPAPQRELLDFSRFGFNAFSITAQDARRFVHRHFGVCQRHVLRCSGAWRKTLDEQAFDSLMQSRQLRPFGTEDAKQVDLRFRRSNALAIKLWGRTPDELRRQLAAPWPEIPSGFDLADFQELQENTARFVAVMQGHKLMSRMISVSKTVVVGDQRYTEWEARFEILRRVIEYLESR